ncbi:thiolase family protein [Nocardia amamiensis]|uniref:Probable acetyl-CoA acetyltransferase n=1 Tax=Nocardia amamiensis TaxID=404578 RepID=A0ABS0D2H5_9NOCA|nr:thiolase family protein [Nocardia amamiensis]MBF6303045.1 thiolase family protein [Nocardia amamiensis]
MHDDIWLVGGLRTPFGRFGGSLRDLSLVELATEAVRGLVEQHHWPSEAVSELLLGTGMIEGATFVPARQLSLGLGLPESLPTLTVDRACCSGMTVIGLAARTISAGACSVIAAGAESMSRTPRLLHSTRWGAKRGDLKVEDLLLMRSPLSGTPLATYTGREALARGVTREDQDQWALRSQQRYAAAEADGWYDDERITVHTRRGAVSQDEQPRADVSLESLAALDTVYDSPTVTAGNAPGLNDGACALLLAGNRTLNETGAQPLARLAGYEQIAGGPTSAVYLPGVAIRRLLDRVGVPLHDVAVIEINEAFAATAQCSLGELAGNDAELEAELRERTNPNGGAVALGHPMGASGARVTLAAARELRRRGGRWAVAAICGGFGQADAVLLEAC